jgi:predicted HTH domain antitoxin
MADTVQLNLRLDAETARALDEIAEEESLSKTDIARRYLISGVRGWKLERAIARFRERRISLERAAVDAGVSVYEMMDELRAQGIALDDDHAENVRQDLLDLLKNLDVGAA